MPDIDPEEDALVENWLEITIDLAERALMVKGAPMKSIQTVMKIKIELRLMCEEILQIKRENRTRSDIERAFRGYLERMNVLNVTTEKVIKENVEELCRLLILGYSTS